MVLGLRRSWSYLGIGITAVLLLPLLALLLQASQSDEAVFAHLLATVLPTYIINTLVVILGVSIGSLMLAVPAAWLVARCQFPLAKYFQWALLLPLAMPGYIVAYVYTDLLDYAGPVQRNLRLFFGWSSPQDYDFPAIRSLGGAIIVLSLVLFPYVYLLARTAFMEQSSNLQHASKVMGCGPWGSFFRLSLPMARPALAVGLSLIAMETAADFATMSYFAVPTLTTAVYDTWLGYGSLTAAAKLSVFILLIIFVLVGSERFARRRQKLYQKQSQLENADKYLLKGVKAFMACGYCLGLLTTAFLVPFFILCSYAFARFDSSFSHEFFQYSGNSLLVASLVSLVCIILAMVLLFLRRVSPRPMDSWLAPLATTGYALPGTVLAIGVLVPLTMLDFAINDVYQWLGEKGPGLVLTGSLVALVFAFCIRFLAISIGSIEASYKRLSPSLDMACLTMGRTPLQMLTKVHLPLLYKGIFTGALLVFIESMKELPATLLLRPIGFENLASHVFQLVSDERLEQGALAAITIVLVGLIPLIYLNFFLEDAK
ncbi:iron ABC transporter permease [Shewanella sp. SR44-3]|uniref:ABC transporter permease n=1 Tax=unclassified Shewanella TaxID=196818 RepID=UPI0015FCF342|nr:iron ABC transporter permease [Shewanella sp. SR44-3]MBB1268615.1 iron ABC transporter permease [Shewanella sp. SR44-3]